MTEDGSMRAIETVMQNKRYELLMFVKPNHKLLTVSGDLLAQFESEVRHELPSDFRYFIARFGGSTLHDHVVVPALDPRANPDDLFSVSLFFGFYSNEDKGKCPYDITHIYHDLQNILPSGMIPFAESGSNRFCISCESENKGRVYCLVPAEFADEEDALYLINNSFTEFMKSLQVISD